MLAERPLSQSLNNSSDELSGAAVIAEFAKINALSCAQVELAVCDWNLD